MSRRFFYLLFLSIFLVSFILINLFLASYIYKHIKIMPTLSISEAPTYKFPEFDPSKVKVLPGSLAIFISKDSPFFTYVTTDTKTFTILGLYLLVGFLASTILSVAFLIRKKSLYDAILAGILLATGITMFILAIIFLAPTKKGDLLCYQPPNTEYLICHTLLEVRENEVILIRHYDNKTEIIPRDWIVGKIVLIIPPPYGALLYVTKFTIDFFIKLYTLVIQGHIPLKYEIVYISTS